MIWKFSFKVGSNFTIIGSTVSQVRTDRSTWFLGCRHRLKKNKRWFGYFGLGLVKNGPGHRHLGIHKSTNLKNNWIT